MCVFSTCGLSTSIGASEDILTIPTLTVSREWTGCENWGTSLLLKLRSRIFEKGRKAAWRFALKESDWVRAPNPYTPFDKDALTKADNKWCHILYIQGWKDNPFANQYFFANLVCKKLEPSCHSLFFLLNYRFIYMYYRNWSTHDFLLNRYRTKLTLFLSYPIFIFLFFFFCELNTLYFNKSNYKPRFFFQLFLFAWIQQFFCK